MGAATSDKVADAYSRCGVLFLRHGASAEVVRAAAEAARDFETLISADRPNTAKDGAQFGEWWTKLRNDGRWEFAIPKQAALNALDLVAPQWLLSLLRLSQKEAKFHLDDATCITTPPQVHRQHLHADRFFGVAMTVQWPLFDSS